MLTPQNISLFDDVKISSNGNFLKQREQANKGFIFKNLIVFLTYF